jgi:hypothetical protein
MERLFLHHSYGRNVLPGPVACHNEDNRRIHHVAEQEEADTAVEEEARIVALADIVEPADTAEPVEMVPA